MKYGVILADPPWQYRNGGPEGGVNHEYLTMPLSDICSLPVPQLAADDCVLLLWATWPQLEAAFTLIRGWGFEYITGLPWVKIQGLAGRDMFGDWRIKPQYGIGYWVRGCTEAILIARRGNPPRPDDGWVGLLSPNVQHSRKPDDLYQLAESLQGPYLELFARRRREGWDCWGNQVESNIVMRGRS